jgi:hypothetical protein
MCTSDVTATLDQTLAASGLDNITVTQRPHHRKPLLQHGPQAA